MSYVAMLHVACRNLAMSNNLHTAIMRHAPSIYGPGGGLGSLRSAGGAIRLL